jgi:hypothetical protein
MWFGGGGIGGGSVSVVRDGIQEVGREEGTRLLARIYRRRTWVVELYDE